MITVRRSEERRHIVAGSQNTWMTFDWEDPDDRLRDGFGVLKVFNEEILSPGRGFTLHTHKDMVVVTYVREGVVVYSGPGEEKGLLEPGQFRRMNILTGSRQFTFNSLPDTDSHVFQSGFAPGTGPAAVDGEKKLFTLAERQGVLRLIASPDGKESSLRIQQDVQIYSTLLHKGNHMIHELKPGRLAWLHVVLGKVLLNGMALQTGDGVGVSEEIAVSFTSQGESEILLFDLP
ncbi:MAG TPA: pirin family protein [bacterium]|nr:pirin family protein [bacterium]